MDESEKTSAPNSAHEERNLKSYKGKTLPTTGIKVYILESYFDSLDDHDISDDDADKVTDFVIHLSQHGFKNLEGRNKRSNDALPNDKRFMSKAQFAIEYKLFHYHPGINYYDGNEYGDKKSKYLVHYSFDHVENAAKVICLNFHPDLILPKIQQINSLVADEYKIIEDDNIES
jgi:hypothetical protein